MLDTTAPTTSGTPRRAVPLPPETLRWFVALAGLSAAIATLAGFIGAELSPPGRASLAVMFLAVGLWGSELLALPVTALLAMLCLSIFGAVPTVERAFVGFASPVLFFLLGTAGLGIAAEHTGLADRFAARLLKRSGASGWKLLADLLISLPAQALVAPSAMSRNAVLVPVYDRVLARVGRPPRLGAAVMLTLGVLGPLASSALLSGGTSPVAAANVIGGFTWFSWFVALAPPYYILLTISGALLWLFARPEREVVVAPEEAVTEPGPVSSGEKRVAVASMVTAALWMLDVWTGWSPAIPAMLALVVMLVPRLGVITWSAFAFRAPWATCVVLAGAVSLATALSETGAAAWLASSLFALLRVPSTPIWTALAIYVVVGIMTLAIPNRAAAITLGVPLAVAYGATGGLPPAVAGLIVLIVVDVETIYPAQTATNLIAYDRGYFSASLLARFNLATLVAAAIVIVTVAMPWWDFIGLSGR